MSQRTHTLTWLLIVAVLAIPTTFAAEASKRKGVYSVDDVKIASVKATAEGKLEIKFNTLAETLYFCPGANATKKDDALELRFVRCSIRKKCKVDHPAKDGRLTIPAGEKPIFVADGKKRVKIWPKE